MTPVTPKPPASHSVDLAAICVAWQAVQSAIQQATSTARRPSGCVTLVAVSKTQPVAALEALLQAGHRVFGENRVGEARGKWPDLKVRYPDVILHGIGPLQRNKVRDAIAVFDVIETLDRPQLAEALAREMQRQQRWRPCLVQVNIGREPQKAGIAPEQTADLVTYARELGLTVNGLMCIPPVDQLPDPFFICLKDLADSLNLAHLSMGMSADYTTAIHHGATHVRVGSALFGARTDPKV